MAEQSLPQPMYDKTGSVPVPDPTTLTAAAVAQATDQLRRELQATAEVASAQADGVRRVFEARLDAMDTAIKLVHETAESLPVRMDEKVKHLEEVANVKFGAIQTQFAERDVRTDSATTAAKTAVDAALQAQKESAGKQADAFSEATRKSEDQFTKQIDQQGELLRTATKGLEDKINDLKDRFNRGEGMGLGQAGARTASQTQANWSIGALIAGFSALISLAALVVVLIKIG
jgi:hypothetical protein